MSKNLIYKLKEERSLSIKEYETLISERTEELAELAARLALDEKKRIYGDEIYVRGLIEFSNICKNDCFYCGIRRSNRQADRYRLTEEEILDCCKDGYELGFRTFVLQGGEDAYFTDPELCSIIEKIKAAYPDCALTISVGERSRESYQRIREAGADRYLLRHETADKEHYQKLHPAEMSFEHRMNCLKDLRDLGYQVGCGFMVGSPYQTAHTLAEDLKFIEIFKPEMCGIGPFVPHHETVFKDFDQGSVELTCFLLSLMRLIYPEMLIPATTALGTIDPRGREKGIQAGANVLMPNLSPVRVRKKYDLYDNKICTGEESAQCRGCLERRVQSIGYEIVTARGDIKRTAILQT